MTDEDSLTASRAGLCPSTHPPSRLRETGYTLSDNAEEHYCAVHLRNQVFTVGKNTIVPNRDFPGHGSIGRPDSRAFFLGGIR